jgi:BlaR1 peptidase M56/Gram-negative bacterial TonB protein C-terminal
MIPAWMVFSVVTGCAFTMAAIAADRLASIGGRPRRYVWFAAMLVTTCWPAITLIRTAVFPGRDPLGAGVLPASGAYRLSAILVSAPVWDVAPYWGALILLAWGVISVGLVARLVFAVRYIRRRQTTWRPVEIDGVSVHIASDGGPAVVGLRPMHVVLPEWVLGMNQAHRELILRHEAEHRKARDPYLLLIATLLTALFPWNLPLWFQAARLRTTIEIDCDARVLHTHPRWREYALLLLTIAQRQAGKTRSLAPALSEPTSNLERRITAMRTTPTFSRFRALCLGFAATAAFALACAVDKPQSPDRTSQLQANAVQKNTVGSPQSVGASANTTFFEFQLEKPAAPRGTQHLQYPPAMKGSGVGGEVLAQFVVDKTGRVDMRSFKALESPGPEFTAAVKAALPTWRFDAAVVGGAKVAQLVQQVFGFGSHSSAVCRTNAQC